MKDILTHLTEAIGDAIAWHINYNELGEEVVESGCGGGSSISGCGSSRPSRHRHSSGGCGSSHNNNSGCGSSHPSRHRYSSYSCGSSRYGSGGCGSSRYRSSGGCGSSGGC